MKLCAVFWCLTLPLWCHAQSSPAIQTQREFDLQIVAEGRWHPTWVDWDPAGRMWLATASQDSGPQRRGNLLVFDKPGTSDPRKVYSGPALNSFVFYRDGVIAGTGSGALLLRNACNFLTESVIVQPVFSTGPFHNLRRGLDGWIYASASEHSERLSRLVRFKPTETSFQTLATLESSTVAFDLSWEHELFFSRPEGPHLSHVGLFQRYIGSGGISNAAPHRKVEDHAHAWGATSRAGISTLASIAGNAGPAQSFAAAVPTIPFERVSGLCIYEGGAWPERFHGNSYVCDPELHLVHEDVISRPESAYYEGTQRTAGEFIGSADTSFRPTAVRYGPDGALYVLGSHPPPGMLASQGRSAGLLNALPYGCVWRVQHKHPRPVKTLDLAGASPEELATALEHPNGLVRETALRLLVEQHPGKSVLRGPEYGRKNVAPEGLNRSTVAPLLTNLLYSSRHAPARVAALWGLYRLGALTTEVWTNAIADSHSAVQKVAWLALAESQDPVTRDVEKTAEKQFKDAEERVRIAILMALSKGPLTPDGRKAVAKLFPDVKDIWSKSVLLTIARETPLEVLKIAFASDKSESFRELAVPLVEQLSAQPGGQEKVKEVVAKSDPEKTEKLTAAVKEALAKRQGVR